MLTVIAEIRQKVRALCSDLSKKGVESFSYSSGSQIFTLQESYPENITSVTKKGVTLGSAEWSYDSSTNELTIIASLSAGDIIICRYTYYKYSTSELDEYIRGSLVWISIYSHCDTDFELESDDIFPTLNSKEEDLVSVIASILIKPNYNRYSLPNLTVHYPRSIDKETKIKKLIENFYRGLGVNGIITVE